jgi:hypothetical protein
MRINWDALMRALVLVRIGQELGTDSKAARLVHDAIELISIIPASLFL